MRPTSIFLLLALFDFVANGQSFPRKIENGVELLNHLTSNVDVSSLEGEVGTGVTYILTKIDSNGSVEWHKILGEFDRRVSNICLGAMVKISAFGPECFEGYRGLPDNMLFTFVIFGNSKSQTKWDPPDTKPFFESGLIDDRTFIADAFISLELWQIANDTTKDPSNPPVVVAMFGPGYYAKDNDPSNPPVVAAMFGPGYYAKDDDTPTTNFHYSIGMEYLEQEKFEEAVRELNLARRGNPTDHEIYFSRGLAYLGLGRGSRACKDWTNAVRLGNERAQALIDQHCKQE